MGGFGMVYEDPFYDEDGVLIDEDFEEEVEDPSELITELERYSPFITMNS